jgi:SAM-dependent methyltransferase
MATNFWSSPVDGTDGRLDAGAFHRNREPIFAVLEPHLRGKRGMVLELGSGSGQHAVDYASRLPDITWQPADYDPDVLSSIEAWRKYSGLPNLRPPLRIDLSNRNWPTLDAPAIAPASLVAVFCANVIHIAPWSVAEGLFAAAPQLLQPDGKLFLYGPFKRAGVHTAHSNEAFDRSLRARNPEWGVRDMDDVRALAEQGGLTLVQTLPMPANNFTLVFRCAG